MPNEPTAEDLALVPTRASLPFVSPMLTYPDGRVMELTIQARSARDRAACNRAAIKAGATHGIDFDDDTWAIECVFYGIVRPRLEDHQKSILWSWNPFVIDELADAIERLEKIPARQLEKELERLAGVTVAQPDQPKPASRRRRGGKPLDRGAGATPEPASE